jgi:hypothetical protein
MVQYPSQPIPVPIDRLKPARSIWAIWAQGRQRNSCGLVDAGVPAGVRILRPFMTGGDSKIIINNMGLHRFPCFPGFKKIVCVLLKHFSLRCFGVYGCFTFSTPRVVQFSFLSVSLFSLSRLGKWKALPVFIYPSTHLVACILHFFHLIVSLSMLIQYL